MRDAEYRRQRAELVRQILDYILDLGDESPWIEGKGHIKKAVLNFAAMFQWMAVHYQFFPTIVESLLTWDSAVLISSLIVGYVIDFAAIIMYELHEQAFGDMTMLTFPILIQQQCDKASVIVVLGVYQRVKAIVVDSTSLIKSLLKGLIGL